MKVSLDSSSGQFDWSCVKGAVPLESSWGKEFSLDIVDLEHLLQILKTVDTCLILTKADLNGFDFSLEAYDTYRE